VAPLTRSSTVTDAVPHTATRGDGKRLSSVAFRLDEDSDDRLFMPRRFGRVSRQRFVRDRWRRWLRHVGGTVTDDQAVVIRALIDSEWDSLRLAAGGDMSRDAVDARIRLRGDMRRALRSLCKAAAPTPPLSSSLAGVRRARRA